MANSQGASGTIKPLDIGAFWPATPVVTGGETTTGGRRSLVDLAYNHNTIMSQHRPTLHCSFGASIVTVTSLTYAQAFVIRFAPMVLTETNRNKVTIKFYAKNSLALAVTSIRVTSSAGNASVSITSTTAAWYSVTVPVDSANVGVELLEVDGLTSAPNTVTIYGYKAFQSNLSTSATPATAEDSGWIPQDVNQYGADKPLTVSMVRDLAAGASQVYRQGGRHVYSRHGNFASPRNANYTTMLGTVAYQPRQGVSKLRIWMHGHTTGWTSGTGASVNFVWLENESVTAGVTMNTSSSSLGTNASPVTWAMEDVELKIPSGASGMLRLGIFATPGIDSGTWPAIKHIYIYEEHR